MKTGSMKTTPRTPRRILARSTPVLVLALFACGEDQGSDPAPAGSSGADAAGTPGTGTSSAAAGASGPIRLQDVRAQSGITWAHHFIDHETGTTYKVNPYDHGSGVLVADVNGDDVDDLYFLDFLGDNAMYLGNGDGSFRDVTAASGLAMSRAISVGGCFGDYDNDGDQDLYVTTYMNGNRLFRNTGDGTFEDVTELTGVAYTGHSNTATFFDYDQDGWLDLYLTNIGKFTTDTVNEQIGYYVGIGLDFDLLATDTSQALPGEKNVLWRNNGDGTFQDVTDAAGVGAASWNGDASVWDYDRDGDLDLYVANMFGPNNLYRNDGDGTFTDVASEALGLTSWGAIGCRFFDADNDLQADLIVVDMHSDMFLDPRNKEAFEKLDPKAKYRTPAGSIAPGRLGQPITGDLDRLVKDGKIVLFGNSFFHNQGGGKFQEMSDQAGVETWWPWGIAIADLDRDGFQDVFLPMGMSYPYVHWPNRLLHNQGDLTFTDVAGPAGIEPKPGGNELDLVINDIAFTRSSRTAAVLDFDGDGDLDLIVNNFNDVPFVFRNDSPTKAWVAVRLVGNGQGTSLDAVGSTVVVEAGGQTQIRMIENATGYLAQSTRTAYFGLGDATSIDKVTVQWLGGEAMDVTAQVKANQVNVIRQPAP